MTKPIRSSIYANSGLDTNFRQFHSYAEFTGYLAGKNDMRSVILTYLVSNTEFLILKINARQADWQVINLCTDQPYFTFVCDTDNRANLISVLEDSLWKKLGV